MERITGGGPDLFDLRALGNLADWLESAPGASVVAITVEVGGGVRQGGARFQLRRTGGVYGKLRLHRIWSPR